MAQPRRIRKAGALAHVHGYLAVYAEAADVLPGLLDVGRIGVQALDEAALARAQRGRHLPVAATDVNDQPAFHARGVQDLLRLLLGGGRR